MSLKKRLVLSPTNRIFLTSSRCKKQISHCFLTAQPKNRSSVSEGWETRLVTSYIPQTDFKTLRFRTQRWRITWGQRRAISKRLVISEPRRSINWLHLADRWERVCRGSSREINRGSNRTHSAWERAGIEFEIRGYGRSETILISWNSCGEFHDWLLRYSKPFNCPLLREALYFTAFFHAPEHQRTDGEAYAIRVSIFVNAAGLPTNEALFFCNLSAPQRW